jgi:hypothetical protein
MLKHDIQKYRTENLLKLYTGPAEIPDEFATQL